MPLSEQEQRLLDEMERHLLRNDADVVTAPSGNRGLSYRNLVIGAVFLVLGIVALVVGVMIGEVLGLIVGIVGFGGMFAGVMFAVTPVTHASAAAPRPRERGQAAFMDRMNERWERRHDGR